MCAGVEFMRETTYEPRREQIIDPALVAFYEEVFGAHHGNGRFDDTLPAHVEVDDIESTLARVWDHGGTIISTHPDRGDAAPRSATFRDPHGNLVAIARCGAGRSVRATPYLLA